MTHPNGRKQKKAALPDGGDVVQDGADAGRDEVGVGYDNEERDADGEYAECYEQIFHS